MRFQAASDQALLVYLGEEIGAAAHERVVQLLRLLQRERVPWIRNIQPAYCSLLITFDAAAVEHAEAQAKLTEYEKRAGKMPAAKALLVEVPVCYGGEFGPDLDDVAAQHGLKAEKVIELHCGRAYHAYFLGFAPGFAYLGDLAEEIATPRLETPRKQVPAGSVGIAGRQTAVYPFATPGGWRLIGRTPLEMFRRDREPMGLLAIGDQVRFRPITRDEFAAARRG
ncbi:MAG TPA: 5-oxoprolinase subunit PxpB [Candidatus Acidoferrum sp.]|nr:5-oxoprolinase subunit PxpB [Candidatus Acidoferrum sp.]